MAKTLDRLFPFVKLGRTGTGAEEEIAHGLGATPNVVIVLPRDNSKTATVGTQTASVVKVTVENAAVYDLLVGFAENVS